MNNKEKIRHSIIIQVAALFVIGAILIGLFSYYSQRAVTDRYFKNETENKAWEISHEALLALWEFPAHERLMEYWYEHADELDVEYDVLYSLDTRTAEKARQLQSRCPDLLMQYVDTAAFDALAPEDQKLFAEIAYSWLVTEVNEIKRSHDADFLFCVVSDPSCETQYFLFSAAEEGEIRGSEYEQVYILGTETEPSQSVKEAMREARDKKGHLADSGKYVDYYSFIGMLDDRPVFIGVTYNVTNLRNLISRQIMRQTALSIAEQIGLSLICLALIFFFVLRPLKTVQKNIRLYKNTKDSRTVRENLAGIHLHNEIGKLSGDVTALTKEMDHYLNSIRTITAEKERILTELSLASRIQENMLPSAFPAFPDRPEVDLYAIMDPARAVGGDFYDYFFTDDDHLCLIIADVSGKGIPAALFMMASKIILENYAMMGHTPAQILKLTNERICANNKEEMFITVWLGILELSTGRLTVANAGHEYPALKDAGGEYELRRTKHGFVVGGVSGVDYHEYTVTIRPGSRIFLYTDGLPEATDAENRMYGTERIIATLNEHADDAPKQLLESVLQSVDSFVKEAEQFDDLTMMCVEYRGPICS